MALSLSSAAILEKNKLESSGSWLILMKIVFPDSSATTIKVVRNTEDVVWPTSTSLITNGDMELDANWTSVSTPSTNERSTTYVHGDTYSRKFVADSAGDGILCDSFTVTADAVYRHNAWVYSTDSNTIDIEVLDGDGSALSDTTKNIRKNGWFKLNDLYTMTVTGGNASVTYKAPGSSGTYYIDDVTFGNAANLYTAFPFELDDTKEETGGEQSVLTIRVSNVSKTIQGYMEADGANGGVGATVDVYIVHSDNLDVTTAEVHEQFVCVSSFADTEWVSFDLSAPNQSQVLFPSSRYLKNFCRWAFNYPNGTSYKCGYDQTGAFTTCNKTLVNCRERGNQRYFGGYPGIPEGGVYSDVPK